MIKPRHVPPIHCDIQGNWMMADWWHFLYALCALQGCIIPSATIR
jgi:hypothetical protein